MNTLNGSIHHIEPQRKDECVLDREAFGDVGHGPNGAPVAAPKLLGSDLTLADYFDIHLDHAPKEGATLQLDPIVLVARSISGGRVNVVGLRLPEDEEEAPPLTGMAKFKRRLAELWSSVAGI